MAMPFQDTLRSVREDGFSINAAIAGLCIAVLVGWTSWLALARVTVRQRSTEAVVQSQAHAHSVATPSEGVVAEVFVRLADTVVPGQPLLRLDSTAQAIERDAVAAELAALDAQLQAMSARIDTLNETLAARGDAKDGVTLAQGRASSARALARHARRQRRDLTALGRSGVISDSDLRDAERDAGHFVGQASAAAASVRLSVTEHRLSVLAIQAELDEARQALAAAQGQRGVLQGRLLHLQWSIDRRLILAPVGGTVGMVELLTPGAVIAAGQPVLTIVPPGGLHVVALFDPQRAAGRIVVGQTAQMRLAGFAWVQYGSLPLVVERVGNEAVDGKIKVQLQLQSPYTGGIPLAHGLPGEVIVDVEDVAPAVLVLRAAGQVLTPRRSP